MILTLRVEHALIAELTLELPLELPLEHLEHAQVVELTLELLELPLSMLACTLSMLVSPNPLNLRGADSPPKFRGQRVKTPSFKVSFEGRPLNLGGESAPLKFRGFRLTGMLAPGGC